MAPGLGMPLTDWPPEAPPDTFPDEESAMKWFESNVWPDGRACPRCGCEHTRAARHPEMPYRCPECKRYFSVKTGTAMEHSRIGYRKWAAAVRLLAAHPEGVSSVQLGRALNMRQGTAWLILRKIRESRCTLAGADPAKRQHRG